MPPDVEPLYQYINTAEFLQERESGEEVVQPAEVGEEEVGDKQDRQGPIRHLSVRKLWCELPEVIESGVLKELSQEERKLQEVCSVCCITHRKVASCKVCHINESVYATKKNNSVMTPSL